MATELRFLEDPYETEIRATVTSVDGAVIGLDRTVFYPGIGVTPQDAAVLVRGDGHLLSVVGGVWQGPDRGELGHVLASQAHGVEAGDLVVVRVDWSKRLMVMRTHSALHAVAATFPFRIMGGRVGVGEGELEFLADSTSMGTTLLQYQVQRLIDKRLPIAAEWVKVTEVEHDERIKPFLWPGREHMLRSVRIGGFVRHACDGLHVRNTVEIGSVTVGGIIPLGGGKVRVPITLDERRRFPFLAHSMFIGDKRQHQA